MDGKGNQDGTDGKARFAEIPELGTGGCHGRIAEEMETAKARIRVYAGVDADVVRILCGGGVMLNGFTRASHIYCLRV